jgi:hypothetical protein
LGVKTAEAGMVRAAAGGGALCFLLYSFGEWRTIYPPRVTNGIPLFNPQSKFVTCISPSYLVKIWLFFLQFSKITMFPLFSLSRVYSVSWTMFICLILFYVSTTYK